MPSSLASVLVDSLCLAVRADGWLDVTSRPGANGPQNGPQGPGLPRGKPLSTNYSCKIKRLRSGNTEFRVALWYQSGSGAQGTIAYSAWSDSVKVK